MIEYRVNDAADALPIGEAQLGGKIGEKFRKVIFERMTSEKAQKEIFPETEAAFKNCIDDENPPVGLWQGEFWGKVIISACRGCRYTKDENLKEFIRGSVYRVLEYQRQDGYLGSYKNERQIFKAPVKEVQRITGYDWPCDWTWNIWCRKYTLWAMLEAYELLHDEKILSACISFTDQLIDMLNDMGAKICETGTFWGLPSGSVLKPVLILYRLTENKKYLDFALEIANEWQDDTTRCCKIIKCALAKMPIHLWNYETSDIPPSSENAGEGLSEPRRYEDSHKAYEMMSCFDGLCELYRITGDRTYFTAAENFWNILIKYEYNTLFSVGFNDIFIHASNYESAITELCDVVHFMRLAGELYKLTADCTYLDYFEMAFYNPFSAGVTRDGSWAARGVRGTEAHMYDVGQVGLRYSHCCVNNMARGFVNMAELAVCRSGRNIYINFFNEAAVSTDGVKICISDGYQQYMNVGMEIESDGARKIMLRIPSWSRKTVVTVNGKNFDAEPGTYFETEIPDGKSSINVDFDKSVRILKGDYNFNFFPMTPYMLLRYFSGEEIFADEMNRDTVASDNRARVCIGASMLALSRDFGADIAEIKKNHGLCTADACARAEAAPKDGASAVFDIFFKTDDGEFTLMMCDFAAASDTMEFKDYRYTIYI